ncbi:hypothetical protein [Roseateles sp.]|uniref:hypothetical protein n=1 Tax=Roseateles sp. TaxID=1971397 RepID=UPI0039EAC8A4
MVSSINNPLLSYLSAQGFDSAATNAKTAGKTSGATVLPQAALDRAAGTVKSATAARSLETAQQALATELRAAMAKAGVKLEGTMEFAVKSDGSVEFKGSDADRAAAKAFLKADTSQPSFASRIATQARDALKLSTTIQQNAAISQAAKLSKTSGGVMSLYTSLMQQTATTSVVFSVSANSSSLTYPGSLAAKA